MIKIAYVPSGNHAMALAGESLLERLHAAGAPVESVCRGNGVCGTCIVEVQAGAEHLSAPAPAEEEMVRRRGGGARCRLSCQARVVGAPDGEVRLTQPVLRLARAERERAARALRRVDWDHVWSHPIHPEALQAMMPYAAGRYGDGEEAHFFSRRAREAVEGARRRAAQALGCFPDRVLFLSGWEGLALGLLRLNPDAALAGPPPLFFRPMEILAAGRRLRAWGFADGGRLRWASVDASLALSNTIAFFGAGIEGVGVRLPLADLAARARGRGIPFGVDLSWTWGLDASWMALADSRADFVTLLPAAFGGPRGILVVVLRPGLAWSGPENRDPAAAVGAAAALAAAAEARAGAGTRLKALRDAIERFFVERIQGCVPWEAAADRLPQVACLTFRAWNAAGLSDFLETAGVALAGTRAGSRTARVLAELGLDPVYAPSAATVWLGPENDDGEFEVARDRILAAVKSFRAVVPSARPGLMPGTSPPVPRPATVDGQLRAAYMDEA